MAFAAFKHKTFGALPLEMERRPFTPTDILEPCTFSITIAQQSRPISVGKRWRTRRVQSAKRIAPGFDLIQAIRPVSYGGIVLYRKARSVVERQERRHAKIGERDCLAKDPRSTGQFTFENDRCFVELT
jgi:hypothetical protein